MKSDFKDNSAHGALMVANPVRIGGDVGGVTLSPGIYLATGSVMIRDGDLTLDAQGNEHAIWLFEITNDLITMGGLGGNVILSGGAKSKNVFWKVSHQVNLGEGTSFKGNLILSMTHDDMEKISVKTEPLYSNINTFRIPFTRRASMAALH